MVYTAVSVSGSRKGDNFQVIDCVLIAPFDITAVTSIESLSNDDVDGNENGKKAIGLISKTTTLHVHHAFLYISLPSLPDYNVKVPEFTFCRGREHKTTTFFSFAEL